MSPCALHEREGAYFGEAARLALIGLRWSLGTDGNSGRRLCAAARIALVLLLLPVSVDHRVIEHASAL